MSQTSEKENKSESFSLDINSKEELFGKNTPENALPKKLSNVNNHNDRIIQSIRNHQDNINVLENLDNKDNLKNPNNMNNPVDDNKNENNQIVGYVLQLNDKEIKEKMDNISIGDQILDDNEQKRKSKSYNSQFVQYVFDSPKLDLLITTIDKYTKEVNAQTQAVITQNQNLGNKIDNLTTSINNYSNKINDNNLLLTQLVKILIEDRSKGKEQNKGSEKK